MRLKLIALLGLLFLAFHQATAEANPISASASISPAALFDDKCDGEPCTGSMTDSTHAAGLTVMFTLTEHGESDQPGSCSATCRECSGKITFKDTNAGCKFWVFRGWGGPNDPFPATEEELAELDHKNTENGDVTFLTDSLCNGSEEFHVYDDCGPGSNDHEGDATFNCDCNT